MDEKDRKGWYCTFVSVSLSRCHFWKLWVISHQQPPSRSCFTADIRMWQTGCTTRPTSGEFLWVPSILNLFWMTWLWHTASSNVALWYKFCPFPEWFLDSGGGCTLRWHRKSWTNMILNVFGLYLGGARLRARLDFWTECFICMSLDFIDCFFDSWVQ